MKNLIIIVSGFLLINCLLTDCSKEHETDDSYTFFAPTSFMPGSSGRNSKWYVCTTGIQKDSYKLKILSSDFVTLFESADYYDHWNGMYKNEYVSQGIYYYVIEFRTIQGSDILKEGLIEVIR